MLGKLKVALRDMLPRGLQVPIKYRIAMARGQLEAEMALLSDLVQRGDRVIDVGGNRGIYAYRLRQLGARIEVFEPNPVCLDVLRHWAKGRDAVAIHAVALSSGDGEALLHIPVGADGVAHDASASIEHVDVASQQEIVVPLRTLDSFGFADATLIKIDVEGHEQKVIEGAIATIRASRPALIVEIEQRHLSRPIGEVFAMVVGLGYRGFFLDKEKLVPIDRFDVGAHQSMDSFGVSGLHYYNNFLFLDHDRLESGYYNVITRRWF